MTMTLKGWSIPRTFSNSLSVLASTIVNRGSTFALYALVARYLGTREFGQMALALTFFYIFQVAAAGGLKTVIMRAVAKDPTAATRYLFNGAGLVVLLATVSIGLVFAATRVLGYPADTSAVIILMSFGLLPFALSAVAEGVIQGMERMDYIAYITVPLHLAKVGVALVLMTRGYGLLSLTVLLTVTYALIAGTEFWVALRLIPQLRSGFIFAPRTVANRSSLSFFGIDTIIALFVSANVIILSLLATEVEVGLYGAVSQLLVPITLVQDSFSLSVFPAMCRHFETGLRGLQRTSEVLLEILLAYSLPMVIFLFAFADQALLLIYGDQFLEATLILRILVWGTIMTALTSVFGQILIAGMQESVSLRIVAIDALLIVVGGLVFVHWFGLVGAAVATMLMKTIDLLMHYRPVSRRLHGFPLTQVACKPVVAAAGMTVALLLTSGQEPVLRASASGMVYALVLGALLLSSGGLDQVRARYLSAPRSGDR